MSVNRQIVLAQRPQGMPDETHLQLQNAEIPSPGPGEVLVKTIYMSLDPYMRGRMSAAKSYAASVAEGAVMEGATVGEVVESNDDGFAVGDYVLAHGGWQEYAVQPAKGIRRLDPAAAPISTAVGVLGMPGITAYVGLDEIGGAAGWFRGFHRRARSPSRESIMLLFRDAVGISRPIPPKAP